MHRFEPPLLCLVGQLCALMFFGKTRSLQPLRTLCLGIYAGRSLIVPLCGSLRGSQIEEHKIDCEVGEDEETEDMYGVHQHGMSAELTGIDDDHEN
jgi:hypothetical protein